MIGESADGQVAQRLGPANDGPNSLNDQNRFELYMRLVCMALSGGGNTFSLQAILTNTTKGVTYAIADTSFDAIDIPDADQYLQAILTLGDFGDALATISVQQIDGVMTATNGLVVGR